MNIFSQHLLKQHFQYNLLAKNIRPSMKHNLELIPNSDSQKKNSAPVTGGNALSFCFSVSAYINSDLIFNKDKLRNSLKNVHDDWLFFFIEFFNVKFWWQQRGQTYHCNQAIQARFFLSMYVVHQQFKYLLLNSLKEKNLWRLKSIN